MQNTREMTLGWKNRMREKIGSRSFYKKAIVIAVPVMLQQFIQSLVSLIDSFIVPGLYLIARYTAIGPVAMYGLVKLIDVPKIISAHFGLKKEHWVKNLTAIEK